MGLEYTLGLSKLRQLPLTIERITSSLRILILSLPIGSISFYVPQNHLDCPHLFLNTVDTVLNTTYD